MQPKHFSKSPFQCSTAALPLSSWGLFCSLQAAEKIHCQQPADPVGPGVCPKDMNALAHTCLP